MFTRDKGIYLYLVACMDNATSDEEYQRYKDLLILCLQNEDIELFIEEPEEWEKYRDIFEDDYLE